MKDALDLLGVSNFADIVIDIEALMKEHNVPGPYILRVTPNMAKAIEADLGFSISHRFRLSNVEIRIEEI